jgi:hypothetical protein
MTVVTIFGLSGLGIIILIGGKMFGERRRKPLFPLNAISKGDTYIRALYHRLVHLYSVGKEKTLFFFRRVPIHSRNSFNKLVSYIKEKRNQYSNNMRHSRLLKKSDGISEFFKNISNTKKEKGEINDTYEDNSTTL